MQFHENTVSPREKQRLKDYVTEVITRFSKDRRVLMWDIYNEPGQSNNGSKSYNLLKLTWEWAQSVRPSQPLVNSGHSLLIQGGFSIFPVLIDLLFGRIHQLSELGIECREIGYYYLSSLSRSYLGEDYSK